MLATAGITEIVAREHSLDWLLDTAQDIQRHQLAEIALESRMHFSAVAAATHGEESHQAFVDALDALENPNFDGTTMADDEPRLAEMDALAGVVPQRMTA